MSSIWQKYLTLPSSTRIVLGLGIMGYATFALFVSDTAEEKLGFKASEEEKGRLWEGVPTVRVVDRIEDAGTRGDNRRGAEEGGG